VFPVFVSKIAPDGRDLRQQLGEIARLVRLLVALAPVRDLLIRAKDLFFAAMVTGVHRAGPGLQVQFSNLLARVTAPTVSAG
jgi:hypothetical protein